MGWYWGEKIGIQKVKIFEIWRAHQHTILAKVTPSSLHLTNLKGAQPKWANVYIPGSKKRGIGSLFDHHIWLWPYNVMAGAAILKVAYGGGVIVSPDCFSANSPNFHYRALCAVIVFEHKWYKFIQKKKKKKKKKQYTQKEIVCPANETKKSGGTITPLHVWWQNGVKGWFPS